MPSLKSVISQFAVSGMTFADCQGLVCSKV